jgi:hypothetical protein
MVSLFIFFSISVFYLSLVNVLFFKGQKTPLERGGVWVPFVSADSGYKSAPTPVIIIITRLKMTTRPLVSGRVWELAV